MKRLTPFAAGLICLQLLACSAPNPPSVRETRMDIIDTAVSSGNFTTLLALLRQADLDLTLQGPGPYTLLAPTDEAFARISPTVMKNLQKPRYKEKLRRILTYHVVPGTLMSGDVSSQDRLATMNGMHITVWKNQKGIMLSHARLIQANIMTDNGVIHVIDKVLVPPFEELPTREE